MIDEGYTALDIKGGGETYKHESRNENDVGVRLPTRFSSNLRSSETFRSIVVGYGHAGRNFAHEDGTDCAVFSFKNGTDYVGPKRLQTYTNLRSPDILEERRSQKWFGHLLRHTSCIFDPLVLEMDI